MRKDIDGLIGGMGVATSFISSLLEEVKRAGGTAEDFHRLVKPEGLPTIVGMAKLVVGKSLKEITHTIRFVINYDQPLDQAIKEGKYGWFNSDINPKNFPSNQTGQKEVELVLFHFGKSMSSKAVITFGKQHGFRPATLPELLKLGAEQPELQRQFPVIALGFVWVDGVSNRPVPYLWGDSDGRSLRLGWFGNDWNDDYRFAFVREQVT